MSAQGPPLSAGTVAVSGAVWEGAPGVEPVAGLYAADLRGGGGEKRAAKKRRKKCGPARARYAPRARARWRRAGRACAMAPRSAHCKRASKPKTRPHNVREGEESNEEGEAHHRRGWESEALGWVGLVNLTESLRRSGRRVVVVVGGRIGG